MTEIILTDPGDSVVVVIDWNDTVLAGTLGSVAHSVPAPLTKVSESTDSQNGTSSVWIRGMLHGGLYLIEIAASLTTGETLNRQFPVRCFNG